MSGLSVVRLKLNCTAACVKLTNIWRVSPPLTLFATLALPHPSPEEQERETIRLQ